MFTYILIAIGGALGSVARYALGGVVSNLWGETFPWGTLIINVIGSFAIGFFFTFTGTEGRVVVAKEWRMFFMTGICGGFTTFSSFSLQTLNLARQDEWGRAGANVLGSVTLCLVAVWLGHLAAAALNSHKGT